MNLCFLGDALDHWKGSVFECLQEEKLLKGFLVDPMASDTSPWNMDDSRLYAQLLRVEERQLVHHDKTLRGQRNEYFSKIPKAGDLFLDPDTGIKTGRQTSSEIYKYLRPPELFELVATERERLVIVYQHARGSVRQRAKDVLIALREQKQPFAYSSYESGTVAMLFFSQSPHRVEAISDCFYRLLGSHAKKRIYCGNFS
jgi:hypothetical protein